MGNKQYTCFDNISSQAHEQSTPTKTSTTVSPKSIKQKVHKIGKNKGDEIVEDCNQSMHVQKDEPWALRFAELFRLEVAQNLQSLKDVQDINSHLKKIGDQVKKQIGLEEGSDMWKLFDEYFDSVLESTHESRLKNIVENTIAGAYHFVQEGEVEKATRMMRIEEDFEDLRDNEYLFILSKVYSQLRHVLYMRFQQMLSLKTQSTKQRFRYVSTSLCLSDDEDEEQNEQQMSCSLPESVIEQEIQKVNLNQILTEVLKTFSIEIAHVDNDVHLIMRKLEFVYLMLSLDGDMLHNQQQIQSLKDANTQMMELMKKGIGKYQIIEMQPLSAKEKYNIWYGMPGEFVQIYKISLEKNGVRGSICSTTFLSSSQSSERTMFMGQSFLSQWSPSTSNFSPNQSISEL